MGATNVPMEELVTMLEGMAAGATALGMISSMFSSLFSIAVYIFMSLALYTIANRRGIRSPWLAWVPVGNLWIMGAISDNYHYVTQNVRKNKRKWMLGLYLAVIVCAFLVGILAGVMVVIAAIAGEEAAVSLVVAVLVLMALVMGAAAIWMTVLQYMALYDIYRSCDSRNATLYLVLNIFFTITMPIFLMICREKDDAIYMFASRKPDPMTVSYMPVQPTVSETQSEI